MCIIYQTINFINNSLLDILSMVALFRNVIRHSHIFREENSRNKLKYAIDIFKIYDI